MSDEAAFNEVNPQEFAEAHERAVRAVRERPPLTPAELEAGWREDASGLRRNVLTGEWDDTCFVHLAPRRPPVTRGDEDNGVGA